MASKGAGQVIGFRYYLDMLMGIGRGPVDSIVQIRVGNLPILGGEIDSNAGVAISQGALFGGDQGQGGIIGTLITMFGGPGQLIPQEVKNSISGVTDAATFTTDGVQLQFTYSGGVGTNQEGGTSEVAADISEFRGVTTLFYTGQVCSNDPYPQPWTIRHRRTIAGWDTNGPWYPEKCQIVYSPSDLPGWDANRNIPQLFSGSGETGEQFVVIVAGLVTIDGETGWNVGDIIAFDSTAKVWKRLSSDETTVIAMNPAHILYQCLTDGSWGRGMLRQELDNDAWVYAANYLWAENFGISMRWSTDSDINDFIQKIIDHIGAALYIDRSTGLMVLRLIRADYDPTKVPFFDYQSGLLSVDTQETGSSLVVANEIVVNWHDPILDQDRQNRVQNLASIQSIGTFVSQTRDYPGICNAIMAERVALRELNIGSAGLKRFTCKFDRRAWRVQPGNVLMISAPDKGISTAILRVVTYDDGTAVDGTITMTCLQDVFGLPSAVFSTPVETTWVSPQLGSASPVTREVVQEASYFEMAKGLTAATLATVTEDEGGIYGVAARPQAVSQSLMIESTSAGGTLETDFGSFCPTGVVQNTTGYYDITLNLASGTDLGQIVPPVVALYEDEVVKVSDFNLTTGVVTIERGGADTVPVPHSANANIFFHDVLNSAFTSPYATGEVVDVQLLNKTNTAVSLQANALDESVTISPRWPRPFVMGNLQLNGSPALSVTSLPIADDLVFTWAARNRLTQFDQFVGHIESAVTAEAGTTYTVEVRDGVSDALIRSHTGITASTYTYDSTEAALGPDPTPLAFVFYTMRDGLRSFSSYRVLVGHLDAGGAIGRAAGVGSASGGGWGQFYGQGYGGIGGGAVGEAILSSPGGASSGRGTATGVSASFGTLAATGSASGLGAANAAGRTLGIATGVGLARGTGLAGAGEAFVVSRGMNGEQAWYGFNSSQMAPIIAQLKSLGVTWVRMPFDWGSIQPVSAMAYDYSGIDPVVTALQGAGIKVLGLLAYTTSWAGPNWFDAPTDPATFATWAAHTASVYPSVTAWEVWNEPNINEQSGGPGMSAATYTALLQATYTAVKAVAPSATVIFAGTAPDAYTPAQYLTDCYAAGAHGYFDAVGAHPYTFPAVPPGPNGAAWQQMTTMLATMASNGDAAKRIWITEFGVPTSPSADGNTTIQAQSATALFTLLVGSSSFGPAFWYALVDDGTDPTNIEDNFGLITFGGVNKPAFAAFQNSPSGESSGGVGGTVGIGAGAGGAGGAGAARGSGVAVGTAASVASASGQGLAEAVGSDISGHGAGVGTGSASGVGRAIKAAAASGTGTGVAAASATGIKTGAGSAAGTGVGTADSI